MSQYESNQHEHLQFNIFCQDNRASYVQAWLEQGYVPENLQHNFRVACMCGSREVVKFLLSLDDDLRVDVFHENSRAFRDTCLAGQLEIVRELLALGGERYMDVHAQDDDGLHAFDLCCRSGNLQLVQLMLSLTGDRFVDVARSCEHLVEACRAGHVHVVQCLLALEGDRAVNVHYEDESALMDACAGGHVDVLRLLLSLSGERTVDVHAQHGAILEAVCSGGSVHALRMVLSMTGDRKVHVQSCAEECIEAALRTGADDVLCELLALRGEDDVRHVAATTEFLQMACGVNGNTLCIDALLGLGGAYSIDPQGLVCDEMPLGALHALLTSSRGSAAPMTHAAEAYIRQALECSQCSKAEQVSGALVDMVQPEPVGGRANPLPSSARRLLHTVMASTARCGTLPASLSRHCASLALQWTADSKDEQAGVATLLLWIVFLLALGVGNWSRVVLFDALRCMPLAQRTNVCASRSSPACRTGSAADWLLNVRWHGATVQDAQGASFTVKGRKWMMLKRVTAQLERGRGAHTR